MTIAAEVFGTTELAQQARRIADLPPLSRERLPTELRDRLIAYVALRASKRYSARFARAPTITNAEWCDAFLREIEELEAQTASLIELRGREVISQDITEQLSSRAGNVQPCPEHLVLIVDDYSVGCMPKLHAVIDQQEHTLELCRARFSLVVGEPAGDATMLPSREFDVVIGDPPYGFNTTEDVKGLARLYHAFAKTTLESLADGGDLLLCLPERSHSGRYSPAFTHRDLVSQELFLAAGEVGRQLVFPHDRVQGAEVPFEAEYYWESQRALRRSILHVQVRDRRQPDRTSQ
jgi:hypothetical protein